MAKIANDITELIGNTPLSKVQKIMKIAQVPLSLETPLGEEESRLSDFSEDKDSLSLPDEVIHLN